MQATQIQANDKTSLVFVALPAEPGKMPELIDAVRKIEDGSFRGYYSDATLDELQQRYKTRKVQVMPEADYDVMHNEALKTEPQEITEQDWWYALEVLPPMKWQQLGGVESFRMCEFYSGTITTIYAQCNGRYWKFMDDAYMKTERITEKVLAAMAATKSH